MLIPIQLDNKLGGGTEEIDYEWSDGLLAAEAYLSDLLPAKLRPQPPLGVRWIFAKVLGEAALKFSPPRGRFQRWHDPSPKFAAQISTLPRGEGGKTFTLLMQT